MPERGYQKKPTTYHFGLRVTDADRESAGRGDGLPCLVYSWKIVDKTVNPAEPNFVYQPYDQDFSLTLSQSNESDQIETGHTKTKNSKDDHSSVEVVFSRCLSGQATLVLKDQNGEQVATETHTIPNNQRQPPTIMLVVDMKPPIPAQDARIAVKEGAGQVVTIQATTSSPTRQMDYTSNINDHATRTPLRSNDNRTWYADLSLPETPVPRVVDLVVHDIDVFTKEFETKIRFSLIDVTGPTIAITYPEDDQELYPPEGQESMNVTVRGTVTDRQSGYKPGSLKYTFNGTPTGIEPDTNGSFSFTIQCKIDPNHRVAVSAKDNSDRSSSITREFRVVSKYKPKTIEELLSPRSYLADLTAFALDHITDSTGENLSTQVLSQSFMPGVANNNFFGALSDPGSTLGNEMVNELLPAVYLLQTHPQGSRGMLTKLSFETELPAKRTPCSDQIAVFASLSKPGMIGRPGTPTAGALEIDGSSYAAIESSPSYDPLFLKELGKNNSDFSVSCWIYIKDYPPLPTSNPPPYISPIRQIIFKGHDGPLLSAEDTNRTFGLWLLRVDSERTVILYNVSTKTNVLAGGLSLKGVGLQKWTHVALVKRARHLQLYLNGQKDYSVSLADDVVANSDPLYIGTSPEAAPHTYHQGFDGAIDEVRIYDFAISESDITVLSSSIVRLPRPPYQYALRTYVDTAYEALLESHGISLEELSALPPPGQSARRAVAERLGLTAPNAQDDKLEILLPGTEYVAKAYGFEEWLWRIFGLPFVSQLLDHTNYFPEVKEDLLSVRQYYLAQRWKAEDAAPGSPPRPLLDPDIVEPSDLNPTHQAGATLLMQRRAQLEAQWAKLGAVDTVAAALALVYTNVEIDSLEMLEKEDQAGQKIASKLPLLGLTISGFRQIRFYQKLGVTRSRSDIADLAHLLTQSWKLRQHYAGWAAEELEMNPSIWPNRLGDGAFVTGNFKRDFLPWRGNVTDRKHFEDLVSSRSKAFESIRTTHEQAILEAQRRALPLLRDRLLDIADLPSAPEVLDRITERMLVDVASTGARTTTVLDQAILILQRLINGLRLGRFESDHPAGKWTLRTKWEEDPKDDPKFEFFDQEWAWLGSYASWRSAKRASLYPENALFPDLRTKETSPYAMSDEFGKFVKELRKNSPIVPDLSNKAIFDVGKMHEYERDFFLQVTIGVMLERAGRYSSALDRYRQVYEPRNPPNARALVPVLQDESNQPTIIHYDRRWALHVDPHTNARTVDADRQRRFGNPYTRFIIARITHCMVAMADTEFAMGTDESRTRAVDLYLEAKQILAFPELEDSPPKNSNQAYLPNPVFSTLRNHVSASLQKLRRGLTHFGTPAAQDLTRGTDGISALLRPTPYRFRVLVERAKQLVTLTQNTEAQYLSALEKRDGEEEKFRREVASAQIASESVALRRLQQKETQDGVALANEQKRRAHILSDRYRSWIASGETANEHQQIEAIERAAEAKRVAIIADGVIAGLEPALTAAGIIEVVGSVGAKQAIAGAIATAVGTRGAAQAFALQGDTIATLRGIQASQERRRQEWELQLALANQDVIIGQEQIDLAVDRTAIASKEYDIAVMQRDHTQDMLKFLSDKKFTNAAFYDWLSGVLAEVYGYLLRVATTVARHAEQQLAFERQQAPANFIKEDYWSYASKQGASSSSPDRRGISGSAQLLADVIALDQYAFETEKRLLNLSQSFSLARLFPLEFEEFRRTGLFSFSTMMRRFDEGFPGHYMRLIKKVRVSLAALIPPTQGIRATLSTSGLSRVVTKDPSFPLLVVRQEPQSVALTSPIVSTGVFELDMQSELLYPFEGMGVDTNWFFELPPAGNLFDYDTLFDVMLTIDYTALNSLELRERVVKQLPRKFIGERVYSVRRDLPDIWYALANQPSDTPAFTIRLSPTSFPPGLTELAIDEIAVWIRLTGGKPATFSLRPSFVRPNGQRIPTTEADPVPAVLGLVSSRQTGGASWRDRENVLSAVYRGETAESPWTFKLSSKSGSLAQVFQDGLVDDIIVIFTYTGLRPAWH